MIINSDERQWTWLDEGLNSFVQFVAEQSWEENYPSWRGFPDSIVSYMTSPEQVPVMTNSESLLQFGNNAYGKPAVALNILRETVLGRPLFDHAFKTYAQRWAFRRPTPADLFRTLEDVSGVDLDWFWRGWFYGTGHVDQAVTDVHTWRMETRDPRKDKPIEKAERDAERAKSITRMRNAGQPTRVERFAHLKDFYNSYDPLDATDEDVEAYEKLIKDLDPWERELLDTERTLQVVDFKNVGEVVMPLIVRLTFEDGTEQVRRWPAEVWVKDDRRFSRLLISTQPVVKIEVDPFHEIADADRHNNEWPAKAREGHFKLHKRAKTPSPMKVAQDRAEKARKAAEAKAKAGDGGAGADGGVPDAGPPEADGAAADAGATD